MLTKSRHRCVLFEQSYADHRAEITFLAALLGITGDVGLSFGRSVTAQTRGRVIFRHRHAESRTTLYSRISRKGLAARPIRLKQFAADHVSLPLVGSGLAVPYELLGGRHLDLSFVLCAVLEGFVNEPCKDRWNEGFEADPFGVDGRLVSVSGLDDRVHLGMQEPAEARRRIDGRGIGSGVLLVYFDRLLQDDLTAEALIAEIGIVNAALVVRDHLARGAKHISQAFGDGRIIIRASAQRRGKQTKYSDQEYAKHELIKGIGP